MRLNDYEVLAQVSAGRDGVSYRAEARPSGVPVELRVLAGSPVAPGLARRLTSAARFRHPNALRVERAGLDADPPFVALEWDDSPPLLSAVNVEAPPPRHEALRIARALAGVVAGLHRLGFPIGGLDPWAVRLGGDGEVRVDPTGLDVGSRGAAGAAPGPSRDAFVPPEARRDPSSGPTTEGDVYALAALTFWLLNGRPPDEAEETPAGTVPALRRALHDDPAERPTAAEFERALDAAAADSPAPPSAVPPALPSDVTGVWESNAVYPSDVPDPWATGVLPSASAETQAGPVRTGLALAATPGAVPRHLGRFRMLEKLGEGGMGEVYRAIDEADGSVVAVKVLRANWAARPTALVRFRKEARMLAKVRNAYVTNLLEVNEDGGLHYIVMEFVAGRSLEGELSARGRFEESDALSVTADVARGLMDAHRLGIVHRDVKPANVLLVAPAYDPPGREGPRVKLSDFGLARHAVEAESVAVTQAGAVVGTPAYMSPEQAAGATVDARSDVYALGATLFHLVAGRPPFEADDWRAVVAKHQNEPPPPLRRFNPRVSDGLVRVVEKALSKLPEARYADAEAFLADVERLRRGEPTAFVMHPALPEDDADALPFDFSWDLESPPWRLWPHVANTDRLDRALGFGAVTYTLKFDPAVGVRRFLEGRKSGMVEEGEELPYEWVENRRLGVYREYTRGPFRWVISVVELTPKAGGGTTLAHRLRVAPRGRLIRIGSRWGVGSGLKKELERVYRRIDSAMTGRLGQGPGVDPFEPPAGLTGFQRRRLDDLLGKLSARGVDPTAVGRLDEFLTRAPAQELARIRPLALAGRLGVSEDAAVSACLHGADVGLLVLFWDILCPVCRVPSDTKDSLHALTDHGHCEACQVDFATDFSRSVELVFRSHPQVRAADTNLYCAAGPAHLPHVAAQVRVVPGERIDLELDLAEGDYRLRGPQLGWALDFRVRRGAASRRRDVRLCRGPDPDGPPVVFGTGGQVLGLDNDADTPLIVRVERQAQREDALTAARASSMALFRQLYPAEVLAPGRLVSVGRVTLLLTALDDPAGLYAKLGDARAFSALHEQFLRVEALVTREGGAVVKTVGEGVTAAFQDPDAAVAVAFGLPEALAESETSRGLIPRLRVAVHSGPAMAMTLNDQLDYFGATVYQAWLALESAKPGFVVLTAAVSGDPRVAERVAGRGERGAILDAPDHPDFPAFGPLLAVRLP